MLIRIIITFLLFISNSFADEKVEASNLVQDIESRSDLNYDFEVQEIISQSEKIKQKAGQEYSEDILELSDKIERIQQGKDFKEAKDWVGENNNKLFSKQTQELPKIDYGITEKEREKDEIAKLLHNYRFKADDIKKASVTHYPLMIFVSSSIPKNSLKDLMIQARQFGGILVFRGVIGSLKNTQEFLAVISKENVSAIIDPRLFDIFQIETVPTFVLLSDVSQECQENNCQITPRHDRITGNITLRYALEQIAEGKGDASKLASNYLEKINEGGNPL